MSNPLSPDHAVLNDQWSDLSKFRALPEVNSVALKKYRLQQIRNEMKKADVSVLMLVSPISLRYAIEYRCYAQFQSHIPTSYAFISLDGPVVLYNAYDPAAGQPGSVVDAVRQGRPITFFDGGFTLTDAAGQLALDMKEFLAECGTENRRVAVEYVNPGITRALMDIGLDVIDGVVLSEHARVIKSSDEIACMEWSVAVAEHGIAKLAETLAPGVTELQLWALLNYTNLANNGDWHDGRMLASGSRINPWLQEASARVVQSGDLVGFDTDMIGPFGYFADISRTLHCGPATPTRRQKELYRLAYEEVQHNIQLLKPGMRFTEIQQQAYQQDEQYHQNAYTCVMHAVGMCDEYPRINPVFRGPTAYDGTIQSGMVMCVESYVGAVGESDGVKLEEQVLVTDDGPKVMTSYPFEDSLLN